MKANEEYKRYVFLRVKWLFRSVNVRCLLFLASGIYDFWNITYPFWDINRLFAFFIILYDNLNKIL